MKRIQGLVTVVILLLLGSAQISLAQCGTFKETPKEAQATESHVLYRDQVKLKNFDEAYEPWKTAYELAPAADGKRASHYSDGRQILKHKMKSADDATKKDYVTQVLKLYDEQIVCYGKDGEAARLKGRKAFDMFYEFRSDYGTINTILKESVAEAGNKSEYIVFVPYASVVEYLFTNDKMSKEEARGVYQQLNDIADHNFGNDHKYKAEYKQAQESMNGTFARIEEFIFDCDYFRAKLEPAYKANPNDPEIIKATYNKLVAKGCDKSDPLLIELKGKYEAYATAENARRQAEFEANNPAFMAKDLYDAGNYSGAIAKYQEALDSETDNNKKADIYFRMASIEGRKLKSYSKGRELARKAAALRSGWGQPYMLIGDLYAAGSRSCGDAFQQRLAILAALDKYSYAKSIDSSVAADANKRFGTYSNQKPDKETAFMMGHKEGSKVKVGCWIGETVTLRF